VNGKQLVEKLAQHGRRIRLGQLISSESENLVPEQSLRAIFDQFDRPASGLRLRCSQPTSTKHANIFRNC